MSSIEFGQSFSETTASSTVATATHAADATKTYYITQVTVSTDQTASAAIKNGGTTIWNFRCTSPSILTETIRFDPALKATTGNLVSVTITGSAYCSANIAGYEL